VEDDICRGDGHEYLIADAPEAPGEVAVCENDHLHRLQHVDSDRSRQTGFLMETSIRPFCLMCERER